MGLLSKLRRGDTDEGLRERVNRLENELHAEEYREKYLSQLNNLDVTESQGRRAFLAGLAAAGVISLSTSPVAAQTSAPGASCTWLGDQQAAGYGLYGLGSIEGGITSDTTVTNLAGSGINIVDGELTTGGAGESVTYDFIDFNPITAPTRNEGRVWYDTDHHILSYYNDITDTTLRPDEEVNIRVYNGTGGTLTKGTVVRFNGNQAALPTVTPAQADSKTNARNLAVLTHDIGNNSEGLAVQVGILRDVDTSAFNAGDPVWLSASSAGEFTATKPDSPNLPIRVGSVLESKMTGEVQVSITHEWADQVGTDSSPARAVFTDQASVGGGDIYKRIDRRTGTDLNSFPISFTGLSVDSDYKLFIAGATQDGVNQLLRLNGDGTTTGNYDYWDASSTEQNDQNEFLVVSSTGFAYFASDIFITNPRFNATDRVGINSRMRVGNASRVSDFGREGGRDNSGGLDSIELHGGMVTDQSVIELWERDYS